MANKLENSLDFASELKGMLLGMVAPMLFGGGIQQVSAIEELEPVTFPHDDLIPGAELAVTTEDGSIFLVRVWKAL